MLLAFAGGGASGAFAPLLRLLAATGASELPCALVGLSVPCSALCSPRLAQPPWPRGRDLCDRCRRYEVLSPLRFASNDYWSLESRPCAEATQPWRLGVEVAQPRFGSRRERCVKDPQYHSHRYTELASCKDTRKRPAGGATPFSARYSRAPSHGSLKNSICARDSALQISSRRVASRTSYKLRESLGAARPTRRAAAATPT